MSFEREEIRDIYLLTTEVENIFINEYMPGAPGDFVKVYLYGLLYSGSGSSVTGRQMRPSAGAFYGNNRSSLGLLGRGRSYHKNTRGRRGKPGDPVQDS